MTRSYEDVGAGVVSGLRPGSARMAPRPAPREGLFSSRTVGWGDMRHSTVTKNAYLGSTVPDSPSAHDLRCVCAHTDQCSSRSHADQLHQTVKQRSQSNGTAPISQNRTNDLFGESEALEFSKVGADPNFSQIEVG